MSEHDRSPRKSASERFIELGPAWISAISGLLAVLFAAGFFVGRSNGPQAASSPTVRPVKTVYVTVTPTVLSSPDVPSGTVPAASASTVGGTLLGKYTFRLPRDGSAPLAATAPTQAQIIAGGGDVVWQTELGGVPLNAGSGDQIASLPNGTTPTYSACKADTLMTNSVSSNPGTSFCIIEGTGKMAGVYVQAMNLQQQPYYITLMATVWSNT
jgi:hypothetical protein